MKSIHEKAEPKPAAGRGMSKVQIAQVVGNQANIHLKGLEEDEKPIQMRTNEDVIQRAIGFEFQTGWEVSKKSGRFFGGWERLAKGERIIGDDAVSVEADDHIDDKSAIEFVTKPMNSLSEVEEKLDLINGYAVSLDKIKNKDVEFEGKRVKISANAPMTATPQASFGMTLNQLIAIDNFNVSVLTTKSRDDGIGVLRDAMNKCEPLQDDTSHLSGVVRLIARYINRGQARQSFDYPKQIADGFNLARTDFGKLLEVALAHDEISIDNFPIERWLGIFSSVLDKNLFAGEVQTDTDTEPLKKGESKASDLTIKEWLSDIYRKGTSDYGAGECTMETSLIPKDKLSKVKTHEGLGALGDKTETVAGKEAGIFESRLHYPSPLPLGQWKTYATLWTHFVAKMTRANIDDLSSPAPTQIEEER